MNNASINGETVGKALFSSWKASQKEDTFEFWGSVVHEIDGMETLAIWAIDNDDPNKKEIIEDLRFLWGIASKRRLMAE